MAIIKLVFKPDYTEVNKAIAAIKADISKSIGNVKITIDSSGAQSVQRIATGLRDVATQAGRLDKEYGTLMRSTTTVDKATGDLIQKTREYQKTALTAFKTVEDAQGNVTESEIKNYKELDKIAQKQADDFVKLKRYVFEQYRKWDEEDAKEAEAKRQKELEAERKATEEKNKLKLQMSRFNREQDEKDAAEAEKQAQRQAAAQKKAEDQVVSLRREYANFIRQIEVLKAQYPEGTFDEIEKEAREAQRELQNLDSTSKTFVGDVDRLSDGLKKEKAQLAEVREETKKLDRVTESFWMNIQKFARWYIGGNIVTKVIGGFRDALSTMKDVDTELANIQKVTDRTNEQMKATAEAAYDVASAYGVAAQDYLESVAEFAKAGFGDMSEQLAEIATKTQLVGDVNSSTANKFLIASNAAWEMNGNVELLNKTLDAANVIENNYATSIEKLAQGMPIAASIASQANMTFEETIAALGTITAVTQETGTKAATALRALILNIIGAVGEYEDGIEVTEESVKSLDGILKVYAKDALAAAKAAGTVVNPMEAIAALAKASEEGLINQAELFEVLSSLGGKLRTNQLTALVENYDMFLEMLEKTKDSAGSADKEISVMLDTWEAKSEILRNTWTKFVSHLIDEGIIERALEDLTKLIDFLDTKAGQATIKIGALTYVIIGLGKGISNTIKEAKDLEKVISKLSPEVGKLVTGLKGIPSGTWAAVGGYAAIIAATTAATVAMYNALTTTEEEYRQATEEATSAYETAQAEYDALIAKSGNLTEAEEARLGVLKEQLNELRAQAGTNAYQQYMDKYDPTNQLKNAAAVATQLQRDLFNQTQNGWLKQAEETKQKIREMAEDLKNYSDILGTDLPESGKYALNLLENMIRGWDMEAEAAKKATEETNVAADADDKLGKTAEDTGIHIKTLTERLAEASDNANAYDTAISEAKSAMDNFGAGSIEVYNAMVKLEAAIPGSTDKLYDFDTATLMTKTDIFDTKETLLDFIDAQKQMEFSQQISELEALAGGYLEVAGAALQAMANQEAAAQMAGVLGFTTGMGNANSEDIYTKINAIERQREEWNAAISALRARAPYSGGGSGGGGSSGSSGSTTITDEELNRLKSIVDLRKQELSFLEASGAENDAIVAKYKEIQASLHDQAEYLRQSLNTLIEEGGKESEINSLTQQITALSTEWWNIQKKIAQATGEIVDELENAENAEERIVNRWSEKGYLTGRQVREQGGVIEGEEDEDDYSRSGTNTSSGIADTTDHVLEALQKTVALRKAELNYLQASGAEYAVIAAKQREIQEALLRQADYMKSIGADEAEILSLGTEWWNIQNSIIDTLKKKQEELFDQIKKTVDEYYDKIVNDKKEELEYEEKILAVQQAQAALANAQAERTVRYWNASTGQWEWAANAKNVKSAQDSLKKAQESLNDYQKNQAWKEFKTAWEYVAQQIKDGSMTFRAAYDYMLEETKKISDQYGVDMTDILRESLGKFASMDFGISGLTQDIADLIGGSVGNLKTSLTDFENVLKQLISSTGIAAQGIGKSILDLLGIGSSGVGGKSRLNPQDLVPSSVPDAGKRELIQLEEAANAPPKWSGRYGGSNPYTDPMRWTDPEKWAAYSKLMEADPEYVAKLTALSDAINRGDATKEELDALYNSLYSSKEGSSGYFGAYQDENGTTGFVKAGYGNANGEHLLIINGQLYEGGVDPGTMLQDLWGNRWVVGLDGHSLAPIDRAWDAEMMDMENNDLSIMGADGELEADQGPLPEPVNNIGTQNNGDTYNLGGVTISEGDAKTMTVFDFVELSAKLGQFNGR